MIFVTVGTQNFQFNRLFQTLDQLEVKQDIFAQIGYTDYLPENYKYTDFLDSEEMSLYLKKCSVLITHGGTSTIIQGLKQGKKVIVVPRLKDFGEHVDNHQLEIAEMFVNNGFIEPVYDISNLNNALLNIEIKKYKTYSFNNIDLLNDIDNKLRKNLSITIGG